jgi:hypothetical protein
LIGGHSCCVFLTQFPFFQFEQWIIYGYSPGYVVCLSRFHTCGYRIFHVARLETEN